MITTYVIGCIALIIKPGPDLMCTLATAISDGKARASTLMAGLVLGCWLWIWLLAAAVASFFTSHPFSCSSSSHTDFVVYYPQTETSHATNTLYLLDNARRMVRWLLE